MSSIRSNWLSSTLSHGLTIYRHTFKRLRPVHAGLHSLIRRLVIPAVERSRQFYTIADDPFWFRLELLLGKHETETVRQFERLLQPGMTVLDIGAHVGYYARIASRLIGPQGQVFAFEPHPRTYATLQRNIATCDNVTTARLAVGEAAGTAELYDYLMMSASGSLHYDESMVDIQRAQLSEDDIAPRIASDFPVETFSVDVVPIDDFLAEQGIERVDMVKMDIEGAEMGALRGMRQTITNSPGLVLIMEYNPQALKAFDVDPQAALREVLAMGFDSMQAINADGSLTDLTHNPEQIAQMTHALMTHMGVVNLLFVRNHPTAKHG